MDILLLEVHLIHGRQLKKLVNEDCMQERVEKSIDQIIKIIICC